MVESLSCPRPSTNRRLRLEALEDRWSLGGAGYLDALLGFGSAMAASSRMGEILGDNMALVRTIGGTSGNDNSVGGIATGNEVITDFNGALNPGDREYAFFEQGPSDKGANDGFTYSSVTALDSEISGNQDGFGILQSNSGNDPIRGNLIGTSAGGTTAIADARASFSVQANYIGTNAASTTSTSSTSNASGGTNATPASPIRGNNNQKARSVSANESTAADINDPNVVRITAQNRNTPTMMGGWNPALRSIMVMNDGSRWFAAEQGTNIEVNSAIVYYRLGPDGWQRAGSVMLPAGIQQNMAMITNGRMIYAYGCTRTSVIEAWFDTAKPRWNLISGNAISASGHAVDPGAESNYVGAAWHNNTRIVWWTNVGRSGSGGNWTYSYNRGRGWNGPIVSGLGGYNEVGYVRAQFDDQSRLRMIGESYRGQFPSGTRLLSSATVKLGNAAKWTPLLSRVAQSPLDLWQEEFGDKTQYLYETSRSKVGYSSDAKFAGNSTSFSALHARFIASRDHLGLVLAFKNSVEVRIIPRSEATGYIDWNAIQPIKFDLPKSLKSTGVSAIWNVDESKQPNESNRLEFAICGAFPAHDNLIYYYTISQP